MVEKWKLALKEFLKKYEEDDDVIGALLCGSYATGNYNDNSDIDVHLILKDNVSYRKRGNTESNSYLIEYFMNPVWKLKEEMEDELRNGNLCTSMMFAYGKIIYDLDGSVKELQDLALEYIDRPFKNISSSKLDINNYHVWDLLDELKVSLKEERLDFNKIYYMLLNDIYDIYAEYLGVQKLPKTKIYKILTDEDYRKKYHVFKLPEDEFINLYLKCYNLDKPDRMYKNIEKLINYYYKKQGGFNIRTFELKTEIVRKD